MIKKSILAIATALFAFTALADQNSNTVIAAMKAAMTKSGDYSIDFTASTPGMGSATGMFIVSGDKYYIKVQRHEQFSDGDTQWEINPSDKEVIVDYVDLDSRNILVNPTKAFDFAPDEFESSYMGVVKMNEIPCHGILLTPTKRMTGFGTVNVYVSVATDLPVSLSYDFEGERLTVRIDKFTGGVDAVPSLFTFDAAKYKGFEVIDFR